MRLIDEAWRYRHFIFSSIYNEFRAKFIRSRLGSAWIVLNPLLQVVMFAFVLSAVLSSKLPGIDNRYAYAIYLTAGMLGWNLFAEIVGRCLTIFMDNANLIKKMAFPKITLPLIVTGSAAVNSILLFISILLIFGLLGHFPGTSLLWVLPLTLLTILFSVGIGLFFGILNVFIRDIGQVVPIVLQFWFWFTPVVYPTSIIPQRFEPWLAMNPMYHIIEGYHTVLFTGQPPALKALSVVLLFSLVILAFSLFFFRKASPEMVDVL